LSHFPPPACCSVLLCFQEHLQQGNALNKQVVKVKTLKSYLCKAASWITDAGFPDPRFSATHTHASLHAAWLPRFQQVWTAQRLWEVAADRKEPITRSLVLDLYRATAKSHPDSLAAAVYDWTALGLSAGFRGMDRQ